MKDSIHRVISLSGGMDSTALLINLINQNKKIWALSFDYGQKHKIELELVKKNLEYINEFYPGGVEHKIIDLSSINSLLFSALTSNTEMPEGNYDLENMKQTVVPNRNSIFLSIAYGYALSISKKFDSTVEICLGVHGGDHTVYPDCREEYIVSIFNSFQMGNWGGEKVWYDMPYVSIRKVDVLHDLMKCSTDLSIDWRRILSNTNTCYSPNEKHEACGVCPSCISRIEAFLELSSEYGFIAVADPIAYVGSWEEVRNNYLEKYAKQPLKEFFLKSQLL